MVTHIKKQQGTVEECKEMRSYLSWSHWWNNI